MKRNKSRYIIYFPPLMPGAKQGYCRCYSKFQMKKILLKSSAGTIAFKERLIFDKNDCSLSFWNTDQNYMDWEVFDVD